MCTKEDESIEEISLYRLSGESGSDMKFISESDILFNKMQ